ncbi:MAG TPA: MMPL family transporter [Intrasporangiaceae bacterium]|nr:MMPL family transporter [Intrasporangiaceae bacterium]
MPRGSEPTGTNGHGHSPEPRRGGPDHHRARHASQVRTPRRILLAAIALILVWFAIGGIGGMSIGGLSQLQENDAASFLPEDAESTVVAAALEEFQEDSALPLILVAAREGGLSEEDQATLQAFAQDLPGEQAQLCCEKTIGDYLAAPPDAPIPVLPSEDGQAAMIILPLKADDVSETLEGEERPLAQIVDGVRELAEAQLRAEGLTAYVTGPAGYINDLVLAFGGIDGLLLGVALAVVLVILLIVYRSPILPFAVLLTAVFGLAGAGYVVHWVVSNGWITISGQSQGILSILVVGAATDYALLMVSRYKEELHHEDSTWVALKKAWRATIEPISASAATVALGLLALLLADLKGTSGLGPVAALGISGAYLAATTFLPALLVLGRRWIFWPSIPHVDAVPDENWLANRFGWQRVAQMVGRHPRRVWVTVVAGLVIGAAFVPQLRAHGIAQSDVFLTKVDSVSGQELLAEHFDAGSGSPIVVLTPSAEQEAVLARLSEEEGVTEPYAGLAPDAPPTEIDGRVIVQATLQSAADSPEAQDIVERVREDLREVSPQILIGGETAQRLDTRIAADRDLLVVAPVILLVVFLILIVLLRALMAPLFLMVANVLSFAATMGLAALAFNHLFRFPGGDPTTVLYGFVFLIALGIDYSIFLMTRAREESERHGTRKGVLTALSVTGGVITSAGIVLAATFGALIVIPLVFLAQIAFIVAFGVLLDTLIVRSLLVPAFSVDIGRWTWWPSRLWREGHDRTD